MTLENAEEHGISVRNLKAAKKEISNDDGSKAQERMGARSGGRGTMAESGGREAYTRQPAAQARGNTGTPKVLRARLTA